MCLFDELERLALQVGFTECGYLPVKKLCYYPEIRSICEQNVCRGYGTSWACPPAVGTLAECQERVERYERMLLLSKKYELEDSFDFEGMTEGMADFKDTVDRFEQSLKSLLSDYLLFSNEGCGRCKTCTYPDAPCRFPEKLHPSLEGYGFIVSELAVEAGIRYHNGENIVTYFGAVVF